MDTLDGRRILAETRELYDKILNLIPVRRQRGKEKDFRTVLRNVLERYYDIINGRDKYVLGNIDVKDIREIIDSLYGIVDLAYKGLHSDAFDNFLHLVNDPSSSLRHSLVIDATGKIPTTFYRMRRMENRRDVSHRDMFHLPLSMRNHVTNGRFSLSGYPSLYLGTSIYACWEELGRPPMSESMVSRFECQQPLRLLDIRVPTFDEFLNRKSYIRSIPVIIACSVVVDEPDGTFKPEYIIPHLLMEFIVSYNDHGEDPEHIHGVIYTSVFKNDDFGFSWDKYENVALPVINQSESKEYCKELCRLFKLTKPTCDEIEQAKSGGYNTTVYNQENEGITEYKGVIAGYEHSTFGYLEKRLKDEKYFPLYEMTDD